MAGHLGTRTLYKGLRQVLLRKTLPSLSSRSRVITNFQQTSSLQRNFFTSSPCQVKEIIVTEVNDKVIIEGKDAPSPREPYLAKLPTNKSPCRECPLCRLGLTVRHTDVLIISQFIDSKGKQLPQTVTGLCKDQHKRMDYLIVMAEKAGLIDRDVERTVVHNNVVLYSPEEWEDPHFHKWYDETVIDEFLYKRRKRH